MALLAWIIAGMVAGFLAKQVVRTEGPGGLVGDLVVGLAGALVAGTLFRVLGHEEGYVYSTIVAFAGAVVVVLVVRALAGGRAA